MPTDETPKQPERQGDPTRAQAPRADGQPARQSPVRRLFTRHPRLRLLAKLLTIVIVVAAIAWWLDSRRFESTDDAQVDGNLYPISARVAGHVAAVHVEDGQFVRAGAVLVEIDPRDYETAVARAQSEYANAEAAALAARLEVPVSQVGSTAQIQSAHAEVGTAGSGVLAAGKQVEQARAELVRARAAATTADADVERYAPLLQKHEVSRQQYDQAVAAAQSADAAVAAAAAAVRAAEEQVRQAQEKERQAQAGLSTARATTKTAEASEARAKAADAKVASARATLEQAQLNLAYTRIVAPTDGIVGRRTAQVGQNVQPGQELMTVVPTKGLWITANFKETQLTRMRPGQPVEISVDSCGRRLRAHVTAIGGATGARFSLLPPENATGNYIKVVQRVPVRLDLDKGQSGDCLLRPGMSVEPSVKVR